MAKNDLLNCSAVWFSDIVAVKIWNLWISKETKREKWFTERRVQRTLKLKNMACYISTWESQRILKSWDVKIRTVHWLALLVHGLFFLERKKEIEFAFSSQDSKHIGKFVRAYVTHYGRVSYLLLWTCRLGKDFPLNSSSGLFRCAICQVDQPASEGLSVNSGPFFSPASKPWEGPFLCANCRRKKDAMEGKRPSRAALTAWPRKLVYSHIFCLACENAWFSICRWCCCRCMCDI